ncbi:MAG TPA: DUF86 domain-containing protein [Candidatus Deferrimicrobium sp.]|nr:DUF86 domain-containing protein [Candidatus Deferrimicrobium sp.]
MFDKELVLSILKQIADALSKINYRVSNIKSSEDFTGSPNGMEKLDSICMLFIAIGESLKQIDKITNNNLLTKYTGIDWKGVKGFRDIISHHYFDIDAEEVFWMCSNELKPLTRTINQIIADISRSL